MDPERDQQYWRGEASAVARQHRQLFCMQAVGLNPVLMVPIKFGIGYALAN
jgi:hypothetical protein